MSVSIFVVEDERAFYEIYRAVFSMIGAEMAGWAYSGEEAVEMFTSSSESPDLVVMDHRLPGMNGVETMAAVAKLKPGIRILFVSADGSVEREAASGGAAGFLKKPFELNEFIVAIRNAIPGFEGRIDPTRAKVRKLRGHEGDG